MEKDIDNFLSTQENNHDVPHVYMIPQEFREIFHDSIVAFTHPDDAHIVKKMQTSGPLA